MSQRGKIHACVKAMHNIYLKFTKYPKQCIPQMIHKSYSRTTNRHRFMLVNKISILKPQDFPDQWQISLTFFEILNFPDFFWNSLTFPWPWISLTFTWPVATLYDIGFDWIKMINSYMNGQMDEKVLCHFGTSTICYIFTPCIGSCTSPVYTLIHGANNSKSLPDGIRVGTRLGMMLVEVNE